MKTNVAKKGPTIKTHEGGRAARIDSEAILRRSVMACLLWEDTFYEDGLSVHDRIKDLVAEVDPKKVAALAIEARSVMNLRHVPLLLCRELARNKKLKAGTLEAVVQRADELAEFVAIYWKDGKQPLAASVKKGLAAAFRKFNGYALAKYNRDGAVKLRDVLFLCHAKPRDVAQAQLWRALVENCLEPPETWEVLLSAGKDKKATWEKLLREEKLGALALLRNLRNMNDVGVSDVLITQALDKADVHRVLPFRFIAAARYAPRLEPQLEECLFRSVQDSLELKGLTVVLVDVSGSMMDEMSSKSQMRRLDAACGLAMVAREVCEKVRVFTFSNKLCEVGPRRGFALRDAIVNSQPHKSTLLGDAISKINESVKYDRLIVVSDEQAQDDAVAPLAGSKAYMLNVATNRNGVGYGNRWTHIDGFSEACVRYITEVEGSGQAGR